MAAVLWLLSAIVLSLGLDAMATRPPGYGIQETTAPQYSMVVHGPSDPTTWNAAPVSQPEPASNALPALLLVLGGAAGVAFILLVQRQPLLGPDTESVLLPGAWLLYILGMGQAAGGFLLRTLALALALLCLRGLWGWVWSRFSPAWPAGHRLGLRAGRQSLYVLIQCLWPMLWAVPCLYLYDRTNLLFLGLLPFIPLLFSIGSLLGLGRSVDHLTAQVARIHAGLPPEPVRGHFAQAQEQLHQLQAQKEQAVESARVGERFKVELISNVSHDLRTPLTAMIGYGELLEKETLSPEGKMRLEQLNRKAGYMRDLVESLFELTKISSGAAEAKLSSIDLIRLLEQTLGLFDDQLRSHGLTVKRHYAADSLPLVTDGARMHQVFANLVGNAIKYALPGTRIHLEARTSGNQVMVRMTNIAAYEMDFRPEEILQRFSRGDKARSTPGSGLGLAIAQTYTQSLGGSFEVSIDGEQFSAIVLLPKS